MRMKKVTAREENIIAFDRIIFFYIEHIFAET